MRQIERISKVRTVILACVVVSPCIAQRISTQSAMHTRVQSLYNFLPSKVTEQVRESKSREMDSFWNEVKGHPEAELPLLRKELSDTSNPPFFFADGSDLLLSLSQSRADEELAVQAFSRVDLSDFQSRQYLLEIHALAMKGVNVTPAALHMLDDPKFRVFLPEHDYWLNQGDCLQVALLPLEENVWLPSVIERLENEHDDTAKKSLLLMLFYAQTDAADRAIATVANGPRSDANSRHFAASVIQHEREIGVRKEPSRQLENKYRAERRERMKGVSDEAMDDMNELTTKIARARSITP